MRIRDSVHLTSEAHNLSQGSSILEIHTVENLFHQNEAGVASYLY